jgi:hypothetical protein
MIFPHDIIGADVVFVDRMYFNRHSARCSLLENSTSSTYKSFNDMASDQVRFLSAAPAKSITVTVINCTRDLGTNSILVQRALAISYPEELQDRVYFLFRYLNWEEKTCFISVKEMIKNIFGLNSSCPVLSNISRSKGELLREGDHGRERVKNPPNLSINKDKVDSIYIMKSSGERKRIECQNNYTFDIEEDTEAVAKKRKSSYTELEDETKEDLLQEYQIGFLQNDSQIMKLNKKKLAL